MAIKKINKTDVAQHIAYDYYDIISTCKYSDNKIVFVQLMKYRIIYLESIFLSHHPDKSYDYTIYISMTQSKNIRFLNAALPAKSGDRSIQLSTGGANIA